MYRALIVEDEFLVRVGVKSSVDWQQANISEVYEAENGREGYDMYEQYHPDIIIVDISMPVMSGLELISQIRSKGDERTKFVILSNMDEFSMVQEALNLGVSHYFLKVMMDVEELQRVVEKCSADLKRNETVQSHRSEMAVRKKLLRNALKANVMNAPEARLIWETLNMDSPYRCALIYLGAAEMDATIAAELLRWSAYPKNMVIECLGTGLYIAIFAASDADMLSKLCEYWVNTFATYADAALQIGLSGIGAGEHSLAGLLFQAQEALTECYFSNDDVRVFKMSKEHRIDEHRQELLLSVTENYSEIWFPPSFTKAYAVRMQELIDTRFRNAEQFRDMLCTELSWLLTQAEIFDPDIQKLHTEYVKQIIHSRTLRDAVDVYVDFFCRYASSALFNRKIPSVVAEIVEWIHQNVEKPLRLQELAKKQHMNPAYLSSLFRKNMNISIVNYTNIVRLKRAETLLRATDLSVGKIALNVGYQQEEYFYRLFKKQFGITPGEYRVRYGKKEESSCWFASEEKESEE